MIYNAIIWRRYLSLAQRTFLRYCHQLQQMTFFWSFVAILGNIAKIFVALMNHIATKLVAILSLRFAQQQYRNQFCCDILTILKLIYWPIYANLILTDIWNFSKCFILTDICRNFSFFHRYMKIFKFQFWTYIDRNFGTLHISVNILLILIDICFHISIIYVFIYRAL